jgi:tRNA dimethylallyltransferase
VSAGPPVGLAIVGATCTGKTGLAIAAARRLNGEIISVDSRQAYRGMEVGTAAPDADELTAVPHHGIGFLEAVQP